MWRRRSEVYWSFLDSSNPSVHYKYKSMHHILQWRHTQPPPHCETMHRRSKTTKRGNSDPCMVYTIFNEIPAERRDSVIFNGTFRHVFSFLTSIPPLMEEMTPIPTLDDSIIITDEHTATILRQYAIKVVMTGDPPRQSIDYLVVKTIKEDAANAQAPSISGCARPGCMGRLSSSAQREYVLKKCPTCKQAMYHYPVTQSLTQLSCATEHQHHKHCLKIAEAFKNGVYEHDYIKGRSSAATAKASAASSSSLLPAN